MFPCEGGKMPNAGVPCFPGTGEFPDTAWLRKEVIAGRIKVFGEISAEYLGMLPDDRSWSHTMHSPRSSMCPWEFIPQPEY
jgi:hypothetical protein